MAGFALGPRQQAMTLRHTGDARHQRGARTPGQALIQTTASMRRVTAANGLAPVAADPTPEAPDSPPPAGESETIREPRRRNRSIVTPAPTMADILTENKD